MVDGESGRARRAWGPDESEIDDTPVQDVYRARRGSADPEPDQDPTEAGLGDEPAAADDVAGGPVDDDPTSVIDRVVEPDTGASANPFARPGSDSAQAPAPTTGAVPTGEEPAVTPIPAPVLPRSTFQGPAPRRSARRRPPRTRYLSRRGSSTGSTHTEAACSASRRRAS